MQVSHNFIKLLGFIRLYFRLPYRRLESLIRALARFEPGWRRLITPLCVGGGTGLPWA